MSIIYYKIKCPGCDGQGNSIEIQFATNKQVAVVCPACSGYGYIMYRKYDKEMRTRLGASTFKE